MSVEWTNELSVNVVEIDAEHKKLINTINKLGNAMKLGKSNQVIGNVIDELIGYAGTHFAHEETLFDKVKYPSATTHKFEHDSFVKKVVTFKKDFDTGKLMLSIDILDFLTLWLKNHILKVDKAYTRFFNEHGVI